MILTTIYSSDRLSAKIRSHDWAIPCMGWQWGYSLFSCWKAGTYNHFDKNDNHVCDWSNRKYSAIDSMLIENPSPQPSHDSNDKENVLYFRVEKCNFHYVDKNNNHICDWSNRKSSDMDSVLMTNIPLPDRPISRVVSNLSTVPSPSIFSSWKVGNYNHFSKKD